MIAENEVFPSPSSALPCSREFFTEMHLRRTFCTAQVTGKAGAFLCIMLASSFARLGHHVQLFGAKIHNLRAFFFLFLLFSVVVVLIIKTIRYFVSL